MALRSVLLVGVMLSLLGSGWTAASAQDGYPGSPAWISLGPDSVTASPGETVSYTVSTGSSQTGFSGAVLVIVPDGLTVLGQPLCVSGCGRPFVTAGTAFTKIEASFDLYGDETASISFQVMADGNAPAGNSYQLVAYLIGGINTAGGSETAHATLTVGDVGADVTPEGGDPGVPPAADRDAYLSATPTSVRVAPGGSTLYFVQPIFWGTWGEDLPDYTVELRLPSGTSLPDEPICGPRQSTVPDGSTCKVGTEERSDGATVIISSPGFLDGNPNGLYVTVGFGSNVPVDTLLQIDVSLRVVGDSSESGQDDQSLGALVVDPSALWSRDEAGFISGLLEIQSGFTRQGETCDSDYVSGGTELALYEWGGAMLASTDVSPGRVGTASDGSDREACIFAFAFDGVAEFSVYMVSFMPVGDAPPCRACVLGFATPNEAADQVIVLQVGLPDVTETPAVEITDTDLDGLSDEDEATLGTDPTVADTDGDGASDRDGVLAGTDPLDPKSF